MLVEAGFDVNDVVQDQERIHTVIMKALLCGASADKIQCLVDQGVEINFIVRGQNAFHFAIKGRNAGINMTYTIIEAGTYMAIAHAN